MAETLARSMFLLLLQDRFHVVPRFVHISMPSDRLISVEKQTLFNRCSRELSVSRPSNRSPDHGRLVMAIWKMHPVLNGAGLPARNLYICFPVTSG